MKGHKFKNLKTGKLVYYTTKESFGIVKTLINIPPMNICVNFGDDVFTWFNYEGKCCDELFETAVQTLFTIPAAIKAGYLDKKSNITEHKCDRCNIPLSRKEVSDNCCFCNSCVAREEKKALNNCEAWSELIAATEKVYSRLSIVCTICNTKLSTHEIENYINKCEHCVGNMPDTIEDPLPVHRKYITNKAYKIEQNEWKQRIIDQINYIVEPDNDYSAQEYIDALKDNLIACRNYISDPLNSNTLSSIVEKHVQKEYIDPIKQDIKNVWKAKYEALYSRLILIAYVPDEARSILKEMGDCVEQLSKL